MIYVCPDRGMTSHAREGTALAGGTLSAGLIAQRLERLQADPEGLVSVDVVIESGNPESLLACQDRHGRAPDPLAGVNACSAHSSTSLSEK